MTAGAHLVHALLQHLIGLMAGGAWYGVLRAAGVPLGAAAVCGTIVYCAKYIEHRPTR